MAREEALKPAIRRILAPLPSRVQGWLKQAAGRPPVCPVRSTLPGTAPSDSAAYASQGKSCLVFVLSARPP